MKSRSIKVTVSGFLLFWIVIFVVACIIPTCEASSVIVPLQRAEDKTEYLPLRIVAEELGFNVLWDPIDRVASVEMGDLVTRYPVEDSSGVVIIRDDIVYIALELFSANHQLYFVYCDESNLAVALLAEADEERMKDNLAVIALDPRPFGGEAILVTKDFLVGYMDDLGYEVSIQEFEHWMSRTWEDFARLAGVEGDPDFGIRSETNTFKGNNVIAIKPALGNGQDADILVIGAHYDSVAWEPGANDNGSGTVTIMEIAKLVKDLPSHLELRFVFFDATVPGDVGSYNYIASLEARELQRIVGMINYETVASADENAILYTSTADGIPNYLTGVFEAYDMGTMNASDHISFYPLAIPAISISNYPEDPQHHLREDTIAHVDPSKLIAAANKGAEIVSWMMSDASPSYARNLDSLNREHIGRSIDLSTRNSLSDSQVADRLEFTEQFDMQLTQIATRPLFPSDIVSTWAAMVDWWGKPMETHFTYREGMRTNAMIFCDDLDWLIATLDTHYQRLNIADGYRIQSLNSAFEYPASEELSQFLAWRGEEGNCFVLNPLGVERNLLVTTYSREIYLAAEEGWQDTLGEREQTAWARVEELLLKVDMIEQVTGVYFADDGYGGTDLQVSNISFIDWEGVHIQSCSIIFDANDLLDPKGTLYEDATLLHHFLQQWIVGLFENETQKEASKTDFDEVTGEITSYYGEFYPDSYVVRFADTFAAELEATAIPKEAVQFAIQGIKVTSETVESFREDYKDPSLMHRYLLVDLQQAFLYFVTGEDPAEYGIIGVLSIPVRSFTELYGENYQQNINEFFSQFPELVAIRDLFSEIE